MGQSISNLPGPFMQSLSGGHQIVLCCSLWTSITQRESPSFRKVFASLDIFPGRIRINQIKRTR